MSVALMTCTATDFLSMLLPKDAYWNVSELFTTDKRTTLIHFSCKKTQWKQYSHRFERWSNELQR